MQLTELRLTHFRNLDRMDLEIPASGVVLVGANGQGKTNFLEAIDYLARFRSFRGARHADVIAFGARHFRVEGEVAYDDGRTSTVAVAADGQTRRIRLDGGPEIRPSDAVGRVLTVVVSPADLTLIDGSPGGRRRYLDGLLAPTSRRYWTALTSYERTLRQRNELLRRPPGDTAAAWDEALVDAGTELVTSRACLVARVATRFAAIGSEIAGDGKSAGHAMSYVPSVPVSGADAKQADRVSEAWVAALQEHEERDRMRGWTSIGPHRDDITISLDDRQLGRFGSQGERRTAAIALRWLESEVLEQDSGHHPILLLDDVFSELDVERAGRLLAGLGNDRQRFITTPRPLAWVDRGLERWRVDAGRIEVERVAA